MASARNGERTCGVAPPFLNVAQVMSTRDRARVTAT
jgi:hypothetical protein